MNPERLCFGCFQEKEPGTVCPHCGFHDHEKQPYLALPLGGILNGRYIVGKILGSGGFGITYLGYDLTFEIKVAIKEYMPSGMATRHTDHYSVQLTQKSDETYFGGMNRFLEEARILARLQNTPNIVSVLNYFNENNTAYFVMEYVDGMSLKEYLARQVGKIPLAEALRLLEPIMGALAKVHAMNLLHRDISPDNIYITSNGESRLLDFGAARFALGDGSSVSIILKHGYAPEEQYSTRGNQGPWTDVYALAATLYRSITGIMPPDSLERIHNDTLKKPSELGITIPARAENAILKALAVKIEDRFPNMETFKDALNGKTSRNQPIAPQQNRFQTQDEKVDSKKNLGVASTKVLRSKIQNFFNGNSRMVKIGGSAFLFIVLMAILLSKILSGRNNSVVPTGKDRVTIGQGTIPVTLPDTVPDTIPDTVPDTKPANLIRQDLGVLNASIELPQGYETISSDGFHYINSDKNYVVNIDYFWLYVVPIYTLEDVETNLSAILEYYMELNELSHSKIKSLGSTFIGDREAYQAVFAATDSEDTSLELVFTAVKSQNEFGTYLIFASSPDDDQAGKEEMRAITNSLQVNVPVETPMVMTADNKTELKIIYNSNLSKGGVWVLNRSQSENSSFSSLVVYPEEKNVEKKMDYYQDDAAGIEAFNASRFGNSAEEVLAYYQTQNPDFILGERYTRTHGNIDWLLQDFSVTSYSYTFAAAIIEGEVYLVRVLFDDSNVEPATLLFSQILHSVRGL